VVLAFISIFGGLIVLAFLVVKVCVTSCKGPGAEQFPVFPGQRLMSQFYACAVTCGRSFTVLSVWVVLISFWGVLVFSTILLPLSFLLP